MVVHIQQLNQNYITVQLTRNSVPFISLTISSSKSDHYSEVLSTKTHFLLSIVDYIVCNILNTADLKF